jgi:hypothetical protein
MSLYRWYKENFLCTFLIGYYDFVSSIERGSNVWEIKLIPRDLQFDYANNLSKP